MVLLGWELFDREAEVEVEIGKRAGSVNVFAGVENYSIETQNSRLDWEQGRV